MLILCIYIYITHAIMDIIKNLNWDIFFIFKYPFSFLIIFHLIYALKMFKKYLDTKVVFIKTEMNYD